jgi:hypothetical protein
MDGLRFDAWTRDLGAGVASRRLALRLVAGGAVAAAAARIDAREAAACKELGQPCKRSEQCCAGACKRGTCRCVPGEVRVGDGCCPVGQACDGNIGCCEEGERCSVLGGGAFFCQANGALQPSDPCDPQQPEQCNSNVCGCNGDLCGCREPNCLRMGANCKNRGSLACCEGVCIIRRDGRQTCGGGPD